MVSPEFQRYMYDSYGKTYFLNTDWSAGSSSYDNAILYAGYYRDSETGLYHVRNRMYHPNLGRWMQRDPLGYVDGKNLYEYVRSRPMDLMDSNGMYGGFGGDDRLTCQRKRGCKDWVKREKKKRKRKNDWTKKLRKCPCSKAGVKKDSKFGELKNESKTHPGSDKCTRTSSFWGKPAQQCCYGKGDGQKGKLITNGPGAGTPDRHSHKGLGLLGHGTSDYFTYRNCILAFGEKKGTDLYNQARPPNNGNNCTKNP